MRYKLLIGFRPFLAWLDSSSIRRENSRYNQSCNFDCCGNPIIKPKDVIVEKDLEPCCFKTWKPRIPDLCPEPFLSKQYPVKFTPKKCYAGMQPPPRSNSCTNANEYLTKYAPDNLPKPSPPIQSPQKVPCCSKLKCPPKLKLPFPDWDHECTMDSY